jgi:DNA-binding GntR family transcriptional regulator
MSTTSISDVAYSQLARAIETCQLAPGAHLNERAEAARLGMSRTPFRQALHRLALEGLVTVLPKRGAYVAHLDPDDVRDNMMVRQAIETEMAQQLITLHLPLDRPVVEGRLTEQRAAIDRSDWLAFLRADETFHQAIVAATGNERATEAVRRTWLHVNRVRYLMRFTRTQMREALAEHREIVAGLQAQDPERTRWAIRRHLGGPLTRRIEDLRGRMPEAFASPAKAEAFGA